MPEQRAPSGRRFARRLVVPVVTLLALALLSPVLLDVYRRIPEVVTLGPGWLAAIGVAITLHFVVAWSIYRVVLRSSGWFDIATSQLASNAASHVAPAGSAVGAGMQLRMLTIAGYPASQAATALGATTIFGTVTGYVVLPIGVLVAGAFGNAVDPRLMGAMWVGAAVLTAALVSVLVLAGRDGPWQRVARAAAAMLHRLGRPADAAEMAERFIAERDLMRGALRERAALVVFLVFAQPLTDFMALYFALVATGARVNPAAILAAFIVSNIAGLVPFTPGGLGFVEAGLAGVLSVAGAGTGEANLAVATYRLAAAWLPAIGGAIALAAFHRRHSRLHRSDHKDPEKVFEP